MNYKSHYYGYLLVSYVFSIEILLFILYFVGAYSTSVASLFRFGFLKPLFFGFLLSLLLSTIHFLINKDRAKEIMEEIEKNTPNKRKTVEQRLDTQREYEKMCQKRDDFLVKKYGVPDTKIRLSPFKGSLECVYVFKKSEIVVLDTEICFFEQILGYTVDDKSFKVGGDVHAVSSVNNGSVIGRSLMGKALAGDKGAVIGGVTAKRRMHYVRDKEETVHDYTINVNIDDLKKPLVKVEIGSDTATMREVTALLDTIMHQVKTMRENGIPTFLERQRQQREELKKELLDSSEDIRNGIFRIYGCPNRTISLDGSDFIDHQIFVFNSVGVVYFNGCESLNFHEIEGYEVEEPSKEEESSLSGETLYKTVVVKTSSVEKPSIKLNVFCGEKILQEVTALLDEIIKDCQMSAKKGKKIIAVPKVEGLDFTVQEGDDKVALFCDNTKEKALVAFARGSHIEQLIVNDFAPSMHATFHGRVFAIDVSRRKLLFAREKAGDCRYDVYDYSKSDKNVDSPCSASFCFPVCSATAICPSADIFAMVDDEERIKNFLVTFVMVEENTAYVTMLTDLGITSFNYASSEENQGKKNSSVFIDSFGASIIVKDEFLKKLVVLSPLRENGICILNYRDIIGAESLEERDEHNPDVVLRMYVRITTSTKDIPNGIVEMGFEGGRLNLSDSKNKEAYEERIKTAKEVKDLVDEIVKLNRAQQDKVVRKTEEKKNVLQPSSEQNARVADELLKLAQLKDSGILTEEEFNAQKKKLLNL